MPTTTYAGWSKDKKLFQKRCSVCGWTLHDLRRSFATNLAQLGVLPHVVERLLDHRLGTIKTVTIQTDVAEVYNLANYLPEMREAITVRENKFEALLQQATFQLAARHGRVPDLSNPIGGHDRIHLISPK